jgi:hypothetical protein
VKRWQLCVWKARHYKSEILISGATIMKTPLVISFALVFSLAMLTPAQRPRSISNDSDKPTTTTPTSASPAPTTFKAKYEGGMFGLNHKTEGTLTFDDMNNRLLFRDGKQKEVLSLPYNSMTGAYADTKAVQPRSATIASNVPYIGLPAQFIKTKVQYLTIQYNDPDSNASGITSFRIENKELLASVLTTLASKSGMTQRGDVYIKKKSP